MPLILLSGLPSSGKTHRSQQLIADFERRIASSADKGVSALRIVHINDQTLGLDRAVHDASRAEKDARAAFASAVKRELGRDTIVVADGMNYIKGYRYQLYCEAKAVRTTSCVVQPATPPSTCRALNEAALAAGTGGYKPEQFENLVFRHEEPNGMNRWDAPLFVVAHDDPSPPCDAIWEALIGGPAGSGARDGAAGGDGKGGDALVRKVVRPNAATVLRGPSQEGYLAHLEKVCGEIVRRVEEIVRQDEEGGAGQRVDVSEVAGGAADEQVILQLPVDGVKGPQLQRLRRQFVALNRVNEVDKSRVARLFVDYLNDAFQE